MESLYVLTAEHAALRRLMRSLAGYLEGAPPDGMEALYEELCRLLWEVHCPKEEALVVQRVLCQPLATGHAVRALHRQRNRVFSQLALLRRPVQERAFLLGSHLAALAAVLDAEEMLLYPTLLHASSDDDLWRLSVELDRSVDQVGRAAWTRLVREPRPSPQAQLAQ